MTGIDTNFLVDLDIIESPRHKKAEEIFRNWLFTDEPLFIYYHVFLEYQHIVTDSKRFSKALTMEESIERSVFWQNQERIKVIYPDGASQNLAQSWIKQYKLGRKRIIDTNLAAAYFSHNIQTIWTATPVDFEIFSCFHIISSI